MRLTRVSLVHFRNLAPASFEVPAAGAVLMGANGQGKTNFLEAIHYLAVFRSFRGSGHGDAIAFDADHFRVEGGVAYEDGRARTVAVGVDRRSRRIAVDGCEAPRAADALGAVIAVVVAHDDLSIVRGSPGGRRRYLDAILAQTSPRYRRALAVYERVLRQRNELLRGAARAADSELQTWDVALVQAGTPVVASRASLARRLLSRFAEACAAIAGEGGTEAYSLSYRPSVPVAEDEAENAERVAEVWLDALADRRVRDRERGWTTVGPHRDDLLVLSGGRPVARFGSQGEQRTAAIALRLLEAEVLESDTGHRPILLLDDVLAELDPDRARCLLQRLGDRHQRFVTSPRPLPWLDGRLARWTVMGGRIEESIAARGAA